MATLFGAVAGLSNLLMMVEALTDEEGLGHVVEGLNEADIAADAGEIVGKDHQSYVGEGGALQGIPHANLTLNLNLNGRGKRLVRLGCFSRSGWKNNGVQAFGTQECFLFTSCPSVLAAQASSSNILSRGGCHTLGGGGGASTKTNAKEPTSSKGRQGGGIGRGVGSASGARSEGVGVALFPADKQARILQMASKSGLCMGGTAGAELFTSCVC